MLIWLTFVLMTALAAFVLLMPLIRPRKAVVDVTGDIGFYRAQLAEIDRDSRTGLLPAIEADTARAEAGRRLLRSRTAHIEIEADQEEEAPFRRRRAVSALIVFLVPLLTIAFYSALGSPQSPDQPFSHRAKPYPANFDIETSILQIEKHLASQPNDGRGWDVLAPVYMRVKRYSDAATAYENAVRLLGETPKRLVDQAEALTIAKGSIVPVEARVLFERAQQLSSLIQAGDDVSGFKTRYYLALAIEQDGNVIQARSLYEMLLEDTPADAPWRQLIETRLSELSDKSGQPKNADTGISGRTKQP
jgi:cytochrome c-type biogenesis protein CcmH